MEESTTQVPPPVQTEIIIKLLKPVQLGAVVFEELTLSEPTVGELRKSSKAGDSLDQLATLININAKVPMAAVDMLCQRDMSACANFFSRFNV